jgi:hypothetical protein
LAFGLILQACNPSDELPAQSGGSPHGYSRSSAVAASALTGEIAFGAADGHIWVINAQTGTRQQVTHGQVGGA